MTANPTAECIGFFAIQDDDEGFQGSLLVLDSLARPLEFHCTAAIKPTRAQAILYGPTLEPVLFGERLGRTLFEKCECKMDLVVSDSTRAHYAAQYVDVPLLRVPNHAELGPAELRGLLPLGDCDVALAASQLKRLRRDFDFAEPFGRIQAAIRESRFAA